MRESLILVMANAFCQNGLIEDKHQVFANNLPKPLSDKFYSFSFWKMLKNYNLFINMFKESTFCCFQNFYIFSLRYIS